jgi:hypothetical protein
MSLFLTKKTDKNAEPTQLVPIQQALTKEKYDYIAVFSGADYAAVLIAST